MELLDIIKNRRSIREFKKGEIPEDIIEKLIDAIIWAPSAGNLQSRFFYFVFNNEFKKGLSGRHWNRNLLQPHLFQWLLAVIII